VKKLPKRIVVTRNKSDGADHEWFMVFESFADLEGRHGEVVGVYELVETKKVNIDIKLV
jgi:hypothetical protein